VDLRTEGLERGQDGVDLGLAKARDVEVQQVALGMEVLVECAVGREAQECGRRVGGGNRTPPFNR
jgi:hypothetical protein